MDSQGVFDLSNANTMSVKTKSHLRPRPTSIEGTDCSSPAPLERQKHFAVRICHQRMRRIQEIWSIMSAMKINKGNYFSNYIGKLDVHT